ncbi:MAG: hypothetical protein LBI54_04185 [Lachnospiraceae bacterium]|jgi:hypothetical protein|nr:hypothetical protein [Lachnospiraceae bacterium]
MTVVHTGGTYINDRYNWHFCITLKIVDVGDTPTALPRDRFGEIIRNVAAERSCSFPLMDEVSEYITEKV